MNDFGDQKMVEESGRVFRLSLPEDVRTLRDYLLTVRKLTAERMLEIGDSFDRQLESQAELDALAQLEDEISRRVAELPVRDVGQVLSKFEIWDLLLQADGEGGGSTGRDRLIRSIRRDIEGLGAC